MITDKQKFKSITNKTPQSKLTIDKILQNVTGHIIIKDLIKHRNSPNLVVLIDKYDNIFDLLNLIGNIDILMILLSKPLTMIESNKMYNKLKRNYQKIKDKNGPLRLPTKLTENSKQYILNQIANELTAQQQLIIKQGQGDYYIIFHNGALTRVSQSKKEYMNI